jgi:hypothetical protein
MRGEPFAPSSAPVWRRRSSPSWRRRSRREPVTKYSSLPEPRRRSSSLAPAGSPPLVSATAWRASRRSIGSTVRG